MRLQESVLQDDATAVGDGTALTLNRLCELVLFLVGTGTITAGEIIVEEAEADDYSGAWSELEVVDATDLSDGVLVLHLERSLYGAVRARIGTEVEGGTVKITLKAN